MKREVLKFEAPRYKRRAKELFDSEYNYGPKTVERKDMYKRKPKHRDRFYREDDDYGDDRG